MKKTLLVLLVSSLVFTNLLSQNVAALLTPMPGNEIFEYVQVKYQIDKTTEKIQNVTISNGNISERINRDFKSEIELYNVMGKAGWSYINDTKKDDKTFIYESVTFSRKLPLGNRMGNPNNRVNMDSGRKARQNPPTQAPEVK